MRGLRSRLDRLDGGVRHEDRIEICYRPIEEMHEWPNEVGDFIFTQMGVFYRNDGESVDDFVHRVKEANIPYRPLEELSDEELEASLGSIQELIGKSHLALLKAVKQNMANYPSLNFPINR